MFDKVQVNDNIIKTSGSSESITLIGTPAIYSLYDDSYVTCENITVEGNTLDGGSYGIYIDASELVYSLYNNSRVILQNWYVRENEIVRSSYSIYLYVEDVYDCTEFSEDYVRLTKKLGWDAYTVTGYVGGDPDSRHQIACLDKVCVETTQGVIFEPEILKKYFTED